MNWARASPKQARVLNLKGILIVIVHASSRCINPITYITFIHHHTCLGPLFAPYCGSLWINRCVPLLGNAKPPKITLSKLT